LTLTFDTSSQWTSLQSESTGGALMMLTCTITDSALIFEWPSESAIKGTETCICNRNPSFTLAQTQAITDATKTVCSRLSKGSYRPIFRGLRIITEKLTTKHWPSHDNIDAWQNIIITLFEKTIQTKGLKLESKISYWNSASKILKELALMGVFPPTVVFPSTKNNARRGEHPSPPIGYQSQKISPPVEIEDILPKSFLIERDLHKPDDLHLTQFRQELETSISTVADALKGYWKEMLDTHEIGKILTDKIPPEIRNKVIANDGIGIDGSHVCAPSQPEALEWFLILVKHRYETGQIRAISDKHVFDSSFGLTQGRITQLFQMAKKICPQKYLKRKKSSEFVARLTGLLSVMDCNAAIAILVINNPIFTAQSISTANLYMENGDCYVLASPEDRLVRFSISKPRAGNRKVAHLNNISCNVLSKIVECTTTTRQLLLKRKDPTWKKLFLYISSTGVNSNPGSRNNNLDLQDSLKTRLAEDLTSIRGNIDISPSALRATQGIITFLRTGSLAVTSMVLGNSITVTQSNYIPPWLVKRFGNRTLRVLAQKVIVVATHGQPWALAASDFITPRDLHLFIVRILSEATGNDPFSIIAHRRLEKEANLTPNHSSKNGQLHLHINGETLAALYAYESKISTLPEHEQLGTNPETNLSHQAVCNIARISRLSAELDIDTASEADFQVANNFCSEAWDKMRTAHQQALGRIEYYNSLFINVRTSTIP